MPLFAGRILLEKEAVDGWLDVSGGKVVDWGEGAPDEAPVARGWIVPAPVNAHTHAGDSFLRPVPGKPTSVHELVGPGGWKQQRLAKASRDEVRAGIVGYADEMAAIGTAAFLDFREGGRPGAEALRVLAPDLPVAARVFGRPAANDFNPDEAVDLLSIVDGIGLSARRDFADARDVEAWAEACHKARKPFALHVSEARREDMAAIAALAPRFVVHATAATRADIGVLSDEGITIVVCPRSNAYHGLRTPVAMMLDAGASLAVGTDNGMLQDGNLLAELGQLRAWAPATSEETLLRMATWNARRLAGLATAAPRKGQDADWIVLPERPLPAPGERRPGFLVAGEGRP